MLWNTGKKESCPTPIREFSRIARSATGDSILNTTIALDKFLQSVQGRAFRIAQLGTSSSDDALDLVQDAMFKLVEKYAARPEEEWAPLFYRILHSRINDWHRRNKVRNRFRSWLTPREGEDNDPLANLAVEHGPAPERETQTIESMDKLQKVLEALPLRQQQAFLLRAWEGLDVRQTAAAMECAEGSVKTHYSRAIHSMREKLGEHWP